MANTSCSVFCAPARARGSMAPISRFSSTREAGEHLAAFGDLADAEVADGVGLQARDVLSLNAIRPERGTSMPAMARISDDLPAPFAPMMATISPSADVEAHVGQRLRVAVEEIEVLDARASDFGLFAEVALEHARDGARFPAACRAR